MEEATRCRVYHQGCLCAWKMSNLARGGWALNKQVADEKVVEVLDKGKTV